MSKGNEAITVLELLKNMAIIHSHIISYAMINRISIPLPVSKA